MAARSYPPTQVCSMHLGPASTGRGPGASNCQARNSTCSVPIQKHRNGKPPASLQVTAAAAVTPAQCLARDLAHTCPTTASIISRAVVLPPAAAAHRSMPRTPPTCAAAVPPAELPQRAASFIAAALAAAGPQSGAARAAVPGAAALILRRR